jgi:hypothetical protein
MNNLVEKEIHYAVFPPVCGVRSDRKDNFFEKIKIIKDHKKARRLLMKKKINFSVLIFHERSADLFFSGSNHFKSKQLFTLSAR